VVEGRERLIGDVERENEEEEEDEEGKVFSIHRKKEKF